MHVLAFLLTALSFVPHVLAAFVDAISKGRLQLNIENAMQAWINALGGPASSATGHNLVFAEIQGQRAQAKFCCANYMRFPGPGYRCTWDPEVDNDVLAFHWLASEDQASTLGYRPASNPDDDNYNRHHMHLSDIRPEDLYKIIHEASLWVIRPDRDQYLIYRCEKIRNFWPSLNRAHADPANQFIADWEVRYKLCNEPNFAYRYEFIGTGWMEDSAAQTRPNLHPFGAFDLQSIMMYDSTAGMDNAFTSGIDPTKCPGNPAECALVKRGNGPNGEPGVSLAPILIPSAGDLAFIREFYPWSANIPIGP
ncbi:hypothetical protein SLS60_011299 [Paraconiothyrium brasiliense]|uniref:Uncharacterized protein n=1 Tax=Paraconiothyrium brasiliense TaxID=300254 RepID=A0ABR3QJ94_9PLEO